VHAVAGEEAPAVIVFDLRQGRAGSAHEQIRQAGDDEAEADGLAPLVQDGGGRDGEEPTVVRPGIEGAACIEAAAVLVVDPRSRSGDVDAPPGSGLARRSSA
jgi:hypothetical protein